MSRVGATIELSKEDLIKTLKAKLVEAKAYDKRVLTEHKKQEKQWLVDAKKYLQQVTAFKTTKQLEELLDDYRPFDKAPKKPECPIAHAKRYSRRIELLKPDARTKFTISDGGVNSDLYYMLTDTFDENTTVC